MKNSLVKMDLDMYYEKLDNGLEVYIIPKDNVNSIYVTFSTKFGSIHNEFVPYDRKAMTKFPLGIAHFLEHKLFEQEDGTDPFTFYSDRGCDSNANTSNFKTTYLFSGTSNIDENLSYLLDYVQSPYFTDENVEKEKGIIEQEIRMYDDSPYYKLFDKVVYNAFQVHPIRYPIAGNISSVKSITKNDLYTCYHTFYNPANMFLVVTGNVDYKDVLSVVKDNQKKKEFKPYKEIELKTYEEPDEVLKNYDEAYMDIEIPKVSIGYKIKNNTKIDIDKFYRYIGMFFDIKFGAVSLFNEKVKNEDIIRTDLDITTLHTDKHVLVIITAETDKINRLKEEIDEEISNLKIQESDFERKKKVKKSSVIYRSDNIYAINNKIMSNIINYDKVILDEHAHIDELKYREFSNIIKEIDLTNKTIYELKVKEND